MSQTALSELTPWETAQQVIAIAEYVGLHMIRLSERVIIDDPLIVPMEFQTRQPDKKKIAAALLAGRAVPGARLAGDGFMLLPEKEVVVERQRKEVGGEDTE